MIGKFLKELTAHNLLFGIACCNEATFAIRMRAETAAPVRRTDQPPTNDLRRAVRPEEIFLVTTFINGRHLCDQVLAKLRGALQ